MTVYSKVIERCNQNYVEKWAFSYDDKSYKIKLIAYGRYKDNCSEKFYSKSQQDMSKDLINIRKERVPLTHSVIEEAKKRIMIALGSKHIPLKEPYRSIAIERFAKKLEVCVE